MTFTNLSWYNVLHWSSLNSQLLSFGCTVTLGQRFDSSKDSRIQVRQWIWSTLTKYRSIYLVNLLVEQRSIQPGCQALRDPWRWILSVDNHCGSEKNWQQRLLQEDRLCLRAGRIGSPTNHWSKHGQVRKVWSAEASRVRLVHWASKVQLWRIGIDWLLQSEHRIKHESNTSVGRISGRTQSENAQQGESFLREKQQDQGRTQRSQSIRNSDIHNETRTWSSQTSYKRAETFLWWAENHH